MKGERNKSGAKNTNFQISSTTICLDQYSVSSQRVNPIRTRPNDRNIFNATYRNSVGRNMLRAFGHPVATCCDMLGVLKSGSSLKIVKFERTTFNMSNHVATGWQNARNMLRPTIRTEYILKTCDFTERKKII